MHDQIKVGKKLGSGAFGEVFAGELMLRKRRKEQVAIKTLHGMSSTTKAKRQQFVSEARIMRKYVHDHVVNIHISH